MKRKGVVAFIQKEAKRLRGEQHIDDLIKANRFEELSMVECQTVKEVNSFFDFQYLKLKDEEISEGNCAAVTIWLASCANDCNENLFEDMESFAHRLAKEAGPFGKNVAFQMFEGWLWDICSEDFFSDQYAKKYEEMYGIAED